MLRMKSGCMVPFPEKLQEGYQTESKRIIANVHVDKIRDVLEHFLAMHSEPVFFILELPTNANDEEAGADGTIEELHKDIYYIDGCSREEALNLLKQTGELLIQDGISQFGFGGHSSGDEIMVCCYNVVTIFSNSIYKYNHFFEAHNIPQTEKLITAWDTFSQEHPGSCQMYAMDGRDVYEIPNLYKEWGIYMAERRAE